MVGTAEDRLRLFLLLVLHPMHCAPDELEAKATALRMAGVDLSAYAQVKRFRVSCLTFPEYYSPMLRGLHPHPTPPFAW
jgi:hypothetical protein